MGKALFAVENLSKKVAEMIEREMTFATQIGSSKVVLSESRQELTVIVHPRLLFLREFSMAVHLSVSQALTTIEEMTNMMTTSAIC